MNRTYLYPKWLCSLVLLLSAITMKGQTGLEYWFDTYSDPKLIGMPTAAGTLTSDINVKHLSQGFHTVYFRIQSHGDTYSPIHSSLFFKFSGSENSVLEYWFGKDASKIGTVPIESDSRSVQLLDLDLSDLEKFPLGIHQLNLRVADCGYSPVYSTLVMKTNGASGAAIEYWFGDNVEDKGSAPIMVEYEESQLVSLDLSDVEKFPLGLHQLNMRVALDNGTYSPIYSAMILRMPNGSGGSMLEYWFDEDITKMGTMPIKLDNGDVQLLDLDLTNATYFPIGFHKLNMRVAANGNQYSPIYSAYVMRLPDGSKLQITYWLDDDYKNRRYILPLYTKDGVTKFYTTLDFSSVSSGMHRFKYRIDTNGKDYGVIYEVPLLVTRKYNNDSNVTIVSEQHWLDDFNSTPTLVSNPQSTITQSYDLDPANYEVGQHAFYMQFKNSADVWSEQNVTYFYKEESGKLRAGLITSEDITGIDDGIVDAPTIANNKKGVYSLTGVKLADDLSELHGLPQGVYIIDGKKVMVK